MGQYEIVFTILGLLLGSGGVGALVVLGIKIGTWTTELREVRKAINGPLKEQHETALRAINENRGIALKALKEMSDKAAMCSRHETNISATSQTVKEIKGQVDQIQRELVR